MLPLIGSFLLSAIGGLAGKALWRAWENFQNAPAAVSGTRQAGSAPFATVLQDQTQRFAQAPGVTATDLPVAGTAALAAPLAAVNFASLTASRPLFSLNDIQAP
jgi:hypothetical protein